MPKDHSLDSKWRDQSTGKETSPLDLRIFNCCCCSVANLCLTLQPHGLQHPGLPCPFFTIFQSSLKLMSIESVMLSNHLILRHPFLLLPSIFPSVRVFSNESAHSIRWPQYWSFRFSISPSNEYTGLIFFRIHWFYLLAVQEPPTVRVYLDFPGGLVVKNLNASVGNVGSIPGLETFHVS